MFLSKSERNERLRNRSRWATLGERLVTNLQVTESFPGHQSCVNTLRWSEDGRFLFSGSADTKIGVWELYPDVKADPKDQKCGADKTLKHQRFVETTHRDFIFDLAPVPFSDGELMISIAKDASVCLSNIERGTPERGFNLPNRDPASQGVSGKDQHVGYRCLFLQDPHVFLATTSRSVEAIDARTLTSVNHWTIPEAPRRSQYACSSGITSISALPRSSSTAFVVASNPSCAILFFDLRSNAAPGRFHSSSTPAWTDPFRPTAISTKDLHDEIEVATSGIAFNAWGTKLARYKMLQRGLEIFDVDPKEGELDRGNYWRPMMSPDRKRMLGADSGSTNTFLKHPVFFGAEGNRFVAAPTDRGFIMVYDAEAPTIQAGNFNWVPIVNVISGCDGRICSIACPHPYYDETPIIAASGLDSTIKLIQPVFGPDQRFVNRLTDHRVIRRHFHPGEAVKLIPSHMTVLTDEKQRITDLIKEGKHYEAAELTLNVLSGIRAGYWVKMEIQMLGDTEIEGDGKLSAESVPILVALLNNAALCAQNLKAPSLVVGCCDIVIGWQPTNAKAHFRRAAALDQLQDYEGAMQSAGEAQKLVGGPGKDAAVDQLLLALQTKLQSNNQKLKNAMKGLFG